MPESSDQSHSQKNKDQFLNGQDQKKGVTDPVGDPGLPEAQEPMSEDKPTSPDETDNSEEYPSWLFELESTVVTTPVEMLRRGSDDYDTSSAENAEPREAGSEADQGEIPEWLKQTPIPKPPVEVQSIPEDEWPDWLRDGLEEASQPDQEMADQVYEAVAGGSESQVDQADLFESEGRDQGPLLGESESQENEPLAEIRHELKDAEQAKDQQERPGIITKMTGWLLASSQVKRDSSEESPEVQPGVTEAENYGSEAEAALAEDSPEISAELLASRLGELDEGDQQDEDALNQLKSSIFIDDSDEILAADTDDGESNTIASEIGPETSGEEQPFDKDLRREILSEIETTDRSQASAATTDQKGRKGFFKGLFGLKKADSTKDPAISDQEINRRLMIGLSAAGLSESQRAESSLPTAVEDEGGIEQGATIIQDDETGSDLQIDYLDQDIDRAEEGYFYPSDFEEPQDQPFETENLLVVGEPESTDESLAITSDEVGYPEMRELALQDYGEGFQEAEGSAASVFIQRIIRQVEELSPLQKIAVAVLFIVDVGFVVLLAAIITFNNFTAVVTTPVAPPAPTAFIDAPFPTQVILPGGWAFNLKPVTLQEGLWANQGAEWLQGSEITKWVALPWSKQLEAVVVTFGPDEQIELVMSNLDHLKYKVESVQEAPVNEVRELNRNSPSLLLILANKDSDTRVVVIGSLVTGEKP